uniref:Uncharacterized protein n=1 Tax=Brassica oleracea TaxID=3712 RepID=A0A3P6EIT2_BRAOL|nr:unnamed protein product [Brassica oleracea]
MKRFQSIYKTLSKVLEKRLRGKIQRIDYIEEGLSAFDIWSQRKGKPLILISSSSEKSKLASVSKVVPGKRTVRRHSSFSYESLFFLDLVLKYMV